MAKKMPPFEFVNEVYILAYRTGIKQPQEVYYDQVMQHNKITYVSVLYGPCRGVGLAVCGKKDKFDADIGKRIALARALRDAQKAVVEHYV